MNRILSGIGLVAAAGTSAFCALKSTVPGLCTIAAALSVAQTLRELPVGSSVHALRTTLVHQFPALAMAAVAISGAGLLIAFGAGLITLTAVSLARGQEGLSVTALLSLGKTACFVGLAPQLMLAVDTAHCAAVFWRLLNQRHDADPGVAGPNGTRLGMGRVTV
jgi:hypothetical protein